MTAVPDTWLDQEIDAVTVDLVSEVGKDSSGDELEMTGLEPVLLGWAAKFTVGFFSRIAGQAAYDRWKASRTRKQVDELRQRLNLDVEPTQVGVALADPELRHDLVEAFVAQGLTVAQADTVVDRAYRRIEERFIASAS